MELLLFSTYRFIFEKAKIHDIILEVGQNEQLNLFLERLVDFSWDRALKNKTKMEVLSINEAIPTFFIERLIPVMSLRQIKEIIRSMNQYSSKNFLTLRVNNLASNKPLDTLINLIQNDFRKKKITLQKDPEFPYLFYTQTQYKQEILKSKWYRHNVLIFHDWASAAIVELLKPSENDFICDLCAAPGIKSSLIIQLSDNRLKIVCNDFSNSRLNFTKTLFKNMRVLGASLLNSDGANFPTKVNIKFDKILIDAPCTGSGTFLSHPELKWRQNFAFLNQNVMIQEKLIKAGLKLLKSGGILVYSTCSVYPEEGEFQINDIYSQVQPLVLPDYFSPSYKMDDKILKGTGRLIPSIHNTEGFFVSKLKKK